MVRFKQNNICFSCRCAGVILHNDAILLQGELQDSTFWTLPGGSIELGEPSQAALVREMQEELGISIHIERLLWIAEHFFTTEENTPYHSLGFYYLITPQAGPQFYDQKQTMQAVDGEHGEIAIIFRWFKLDELAHLRLYPSFLPVALQALPHTTEHILWQAN